jgi:outer membrane protein assembly factor BamB
MDSDMTNTHTDDPSRKTLRLWPGLAVVALQWLAWLVAPVVLPETGGYVAVIGGVLGGVAVALWWAFFSRAPRAERWGAIVLMAVALLVTGRLLHESIATGMMGMMFGIYAIPVLSLAFVAWAVVTRGLADGPRRVAMVATIVLACGGWTLVRTDGIDGEGHSDFEWRWADTPEERLLAQAGDEPAPIPSPAAAAETLAVEPAVESGGEPTPLPAPPAAEQTPEERADILAADETAALAAAPATGGSAAEWPGFRGPARNGVVPATRIATDWSATPPVELWRRPVGPGWSSFAVRGDLLYTQEQRGDDEVVSCYSATTGEPVWRHRDAARFWESNAGAGPRATPTLSGGQVYTFGATGILNALDADDGTVVWSRNASSDTGTEVPGWGFASSPLVVDDVVIAATAGVLAAYDVATGDPRWSGPAGGGGYSSPHLATIDGVPQVLLLNGAGAISVTPSDGTLLWEHPWPGDGIVQPALTADGGVLIGTGSGMGDGAGMGVRRISVARGPGGWTTEERWTSRGLKPYFNDFVVHGDHAFGFDGRRLACIDLETGERSWKGGRYGHGQLVLLPDQDLLLVLSEKGELALVTATPDQFTEVARFPAIEGKTWNHPVLVGDVLLVRNDQEMAAFRLPLAGS